MRMSAPVSRSVSRPSTRTRTVTGAALLAAAALTLSSGMSAHADTAPLDPASPATPVTVSADGLPTAQLNGVGLTQVIIGNTVFVGGSFSTARPAGAAAGERTVSRRNLLSYSLTTGRLTSRFHPNLNGKVIAVAASGDGKRLYVGGYFTRVNGSVARRIVALNPVTGRVIRSFKVSADRPVRAIAARGASVWFGGDFDVVNRRQHVHAARVQAKNGKVLGWAPKVPSGSVTAMALAPDRKSLVIGGRFTAVNGSSKYGYGLARVDSSRGRTIAFPAARTVRDAGKNSGITALVSDGRSIWGSGFVSGRGGNLEGSFAASWSTGKLTWLESCHGDTYSIYPAAQVVYAVGHPHSCSNIGGFPDTAPRSYHYGVAFSRAVTQKASAEPSGSNYASFAGTPAPALQTWFPTFDVGSTTAARQGPWHVTGHGKYVAVAGEFKHVNGQPQQGLVRFATRDVAPNLQKPLYSNFVPTLNSPNSGEVQVSWTALWDRDNTNLTYEVYRVDAQRVVGTVSGPSTFWSRPTMTYTDTGLEAGKTYRYEVRAVDPFGNRTASQRVSITIS